MARLLVLAVSAALAGLSTTSAVRAATITEPSGSSIEQCSSAARADVAVQLSTKANACTPKPSYNWSSAMYLPSTAERNELCACTALASQLQTILPPNCGIYLLSPDTTLYTGGFFSYMALLFNVFSSCTNGFVTTPNSPTISTSTTSPTPTLRTPTSITTNPPPTTSPPTASPGLARDPAGVNPVNNSASDEDKPSNKVGIIIAVVGGLVVVVAIAFFAFKFVQRHRAAATSESGHDCDDAVRAMPLSPVEAYMSVPASPPRPVASVVSTKGPTTGPSTTRTDGSSTGGDSNSITNPAQRTARPTEMAMWDDPMLLAVRVPYDSVFFGPLLSQGGFGEVYKGTYRGETVAIKQLLPARRKDLAEIDNFLSEVKLMSTLEHERIIKFIGVAWNALSDACAVTEYMENGDLRSVLTRWNDREGRPEGFDADKVKITLHVAHALTYLHSLDPVVVHRDLKSKNILLDANYDAKLTDFGVSRERADSTMTAAVGTSLWMAPEVMLGERYDEKADIFSFGIVLSELDSQRLPYAHAKDTTSLGRKLPDSAILQMVSLGRLQVNFSANAHPDLVQLGRDCVQLDAKKRPTSAAVLHCVHQVLRSSF